MKFAGISISVKNLEKSVEYYTNVLGFHYFDTVPVGFGRQAILLSDNIRISLFESDNMPDGMIMDFSMQSQDIDKDMEEAIAKGAVVDAMPMQVSLARIARLKDPDGITVAVLQWNEMFEEKQMSDEVIRNSKEWASKL